VTLQKYNWWEKAILLAYARFKPPGGGFAFGLKAMGNLFLFGPPYFGLYLFYHIFKLNTSIARIRFVTRIAITVLIVVAALLKFMPQAVFLGLVIGYITNILCTLLVFIIGVPLAQDRIAHGLAEQVRNNNYNWFLNLFRRRLARELKKQIQKAQLLEIDAIMDEMIGPLLIAIELLGGGLGMLLGLFNFS